MKCCFATVVTKSKYEVFAGRLYQALQYFNSKYPCEILISDNLTTEDLPFITANGIPYRYIKALSFTDDIKQKNAELFTRFNETLTKFQLLNLTDYDYICFLDADIIPVVPIDFLLDNIPEFNNPFYYFYQQYNNDLFETDKPQGELFYIKPDKFYYNQFLTIISDMLSLDTDEQPYCDETFILKYYKNCINYSSTYKSYFETLYNSFPDIVHFSGRIKIVQLTNIYTEIYDYFYIYPINTYIKNAKGIKRLHVYLNSFLKDFDNQLDLFRTCLAGKTNIGILSIDFLKDNTRPSIGQLLQKIKYNI